MQGPFDGVKVFPCTLSPFQMMSTLSPGQFSFLYRQESLIEFGLSNVFYGLCHDQLIHTRLMCPQSGVYTTLVAFLVYFFCESLGHSPTTVFSFLCSSGLNEKKQTSYKVLMGLIVLMFALQTIHNICSWYIIWLSFIYYSDAPDQALDALEVDGTKLSLRVVESMFDLLTTMRLAIADSIMVSTSWPLPADMINSLFVEGLEVLDHM
jgi:hypothetical protein